MAIEWGNWVGSSPKQMRLGVEYVSVPAPTSNTQVSVAVKARVWLQCYNWFYDSNNTFKWWGTLGNNGAGVAKSINITTMHGTQLLQEISKSVTLNTSGTTPVSVTATLTKVEYVGLNLTATVTKTATIAAKPAAPIGAPAAPTGFTATYVSDAVTNLTWTNPATASAPVTRFALGRYDGNSGSTDYPIQGYPTGTSYQSTNNVANNHYDWRIRAENSAGASGWVYSDGIYTTPAAPSDIVAIKFNDDIEVSIGTDRSAYNTDWEWQVSADNGAWTALGTTANSTTTILHENPSALAVHRYRVRAVRGALVSAWSTASAPVRLASAPGKPTLKAPIGTISVSQPTVTFEWQHNALDTTTQAAAEVEYRLLGGAWTTLTVAGATQSKTTANPLPLGTYEWRVRTRGQHPDFGEWSSLGVFEVGTSPTVTLTSPSGVTTSSRVTFAWSYADGDDDPQIGAQLRLVDTGDESTVWSGSVPGSTTSTTPNFHVPEWSYRAEVTVTDASGLTGTDTALVVVAYAKPTAPLIDATWDPDALSTLVTIQSQAGAVATTALLLEQSFDAQTWSTLGSFSAGQHAVTDQLTPLNRLTHFRAWAVSADGAEETSVTVSVYSDSVNGVINYGPGFANRLSVRCAIEATSSLEGYALEHLFSQRALPVSVYSLDHEPPLQLSVSATVPGVSVADLEAMFKTILRGPVWWRDYESRSFGGRLSNVEFTPRPTNLVGKGGLGNPRISFSVKQTDVQR